MGSKFRWLDNYTVKITGASTPVRIPFDAWLEVTNIRDAFVGVSIIDFAPTSVETLTVRLRTSPALTDDAGLMVTCDTEASIDQETAFVLGAQQSSVSSQSMAYLFLELEISGVGPAVVTLAANAVLKGAD